MSINRNAYKTAARWVKTLDAKKTDEANIEIIIPSTTTMNVVLSLDFFQCFSRSADEEMVTFQEHRYHYMRSNHIHRLLRNRTGERLETAQSMLTVVHTSAANGSHK